MLTEQKLKERLHYITVNEPNSIKALVAKEALKRKDIPQFFLNLQQKGCVSGLVTSLNFYHQTHYFFELYYNEIEQLRLKHFNKSSEQICELSYDLKTMMIWFAFEQTAQDLSVILDIEGA